MELPQDGQGKPAKAVSTHQEQKMHIYQISRHKKLQLLVLFSINKLQTNTTDQSLLESGGIEIWQMVMWQRNVKIDEELHMPATEQKLAEIKSETKMKCQIA